MLSKDLYCRHVKTRARAYKAWVRTQLSLCSNFKFSLMIESVWEFKFKSFVWEAETMKFSIDQKFLQKVYQVRFIQHRNFMLSWVEHEKTFIIMGPGLVWERVKELFLITCIYLFCFWRKFLYCCYSCHLLQSSHHYANTFILQFPPLLMKNVSYLKNSLWSKQRVT